MPYSHTTIEIIASTPADNDYIDNKIVEYNAQQLPFTQQEPFINLGFIARDSKGEQKKLTQ